MNTRELDRLLCERLGIEPVRYGSHIGCSAESSAPMGLLGQCKRCGAGNAYQKQSWGACQKRPVYPALSTTGNGMLTLGDALRAMDLEYDIRGRKSGHQALVFGQSSQARRREESAPLALALAAAAYLEIEVPND